MDVKKKKEQLLGILYSTNVPTFYAQGCRQPGELTTWEAESLVLGYAGNSAGREIRVGNNRQGHAEFCPGKAQVSLEGDFVLPRQGRSIRRHPNRQGNQGAWRMAIVLEKLF